MKIRTLLALMVAALTGAASSQALAHRSENLCNGQTPCVSMRIGSAYAALPVKLLCLYQRDLDNKPEVFCGPAKATSAAFVSISASRIEVNRIAGSKVKRLYSVKR